MSVTDKRRSPAEELAEGRRRRLGPLYDDLRGTAIAAIESHSSQIWTDYNVHDPGVTILEHLCWALTEVGYRATHPIADLLAPEDPDARTRSSDESTGLDAGPEQTALFPARDILPTRPVTLRDWRKLLIDVGGVENAWLSKVAGPTLYHDTTNHVLTLEPIVPDAAAIVLRGYWTVEVKLDEDLPAGSGESVLESVRDALLANRNLCEDFERINEVVVDDLGVCADLEVEADADLTEVYARVVHVLERFIAPTIRFHTLAEMLDKGRTIDEVFSGPPLRNGFIDNDEIDCADRRAELHVSDLIREIMRVDKVDAVKRILVTAYDADTSQVRSTTGAADITASTPADARRRWILPLDASRATKLSVEKTRIRLFKGLVPFSVNVEEAEDRIEELRAADRPRPAPPGSLDPTLPEGRHRSYGPFRSVQTQFPRNYGVAKGTLRESASALRKAQARQLSAFLTFFDQLLANEHAQITGFPYLLSLGPQDRTFFFGSVEGIAEPDEIRITKEQIVEELEARMSTAEAKAEAEKRSYFPECVPALTESEATLHARRNRILDHLMARFAEDARHDAVVRDIEERRGPEHEAERIESKRQFLLALPAISRHRFGAFDYGQAFDDRHTECESADLPANLSGLEHRLNVLFGLGDAAFSRVDRAGALANLEIYEEKDEDGVEEKRFRFFDEEPGIELSSSRHYEDEAEMWDEIRSVLVHGRDAAKYSKKTADNGQFYFNLEDGTGEIIARRIQMFDLEAARDAAIMATAAFLAALPPLERSYLIEHPLLRPRLPANTNKTVELLPICTEDEPECPGFDPFSFRITVALPAWLERFANLTFRRFVERVVREHAPSHLFVKICWIDADDAWNLERVLPPWWDRLGAVIPDRLTAHESTETALEALQSRQNDVIEVWRNLRSIYPEARLHDCRTEEGQPAVLDNTKLGTMEETDNADD